MNPETENPRGSPERRRGEDVERLYERGRAVTDDARTLIDDVRDIGDDARSFVAAQVRRRPYAVVGVAAAIGYVFGGGIPPFLVRALLGYGARVAVDSVIRGTIGDMQRRGSEGED